MTPVPPPPDGERLANRLHAHGWTVRTAAAEGAVPRQTYGPARGDGTRPKLTIPDPCSSYRIVAVHPDGRGLVAVWKHLHRKVSAKTGEPSWSLDLAWRAPNPDEPPAPKQMTAAELDTYTATGTETAA